MNAPGADLSEAAAVVLRERQSRDRGWWDEMAACFTDDALVMMSWFQGPAAEFVARTRARSGANPWGRHRLGPPAVRVQGDRAWVELPVGIEFDLELGDTPAVLTSYCRSQYRVRCEEQSWRIERITSVYERDELNAALPNTRLPVDPAELFAHRPSYRALAWYFERRGTPLPDDLPGEDRPEQVAVLYDAERAWLAGGAERDGERSRASIRDAPAHDQ